MPAANVPISYFTEHDLPHVPVSYMMIVRNNADAVRACLDSVYGALYKADGGDEAIIVDTGSRPEEFVKIKELETVFPRCRVRKAWDLKKDYAPLVEKYLGQKFLEGYAEYIGDTHGILDFAAARNVALKLAKNRVCFWIDSDDVLVEEQPGALRKAVDRAFEDGSEFTQIFMDYEYEFAADGTCTTILRRERFFLKDLYHWVGRCHETVCPKPGIDIKKIAYFEAIKSKIVHTNARKPHEVSDVRNYIILRDEFEETKASGKVDPRTVFYVGNAARGLRRLKEALEFYRYFDFRSGSADDRYAAHYYSGSIYLDPGMKRPFDALDHYFKCIEIKPFDPRGYFGISRCYMLLARYKECILWYQRGLDLPMSREQIFSFDPTHVNYLPHVIAAHAFREAGLEQQAFEAAQKAYHARPQDEEAQMLIRSFQNEAVGGEIARSVEMVLNHIRGNGGPNRDRVGKQIAEELNAVPPRLEKQGITKVEAPDPREPKPNIAIVCMPTGEPWGPMSRQTGIGGSEKMVIMLAEALQRTGKVNVSVYADVPYEQRGVSAETAVRWEHFGAFNQLTPRAALIGWRSPELASTLPSPAKKRVVWNHDVQSADRYDDLVLKTVDLVQVQSQFHAEPLRGVVPDEKIWVARNAIEAPSDLEVPRSSKRVVYCSSPDRGLLTATRIVAKAKALDPSIEFVVTYGVTPWARKVFAQQNHRYVPDLGRDVCLDDYERTTFAALDAVGAIVLGRVGFKEMEGLMKSSGVWVYPTRFHEISCMSAAEAQACGMVTLATRFGALAETIAPDAFPALPPVPDGEVPEEYIDHCAAELIKATQVPADSPMRKLAAEAAVKRWNVDDLAREWLLKLGIDDEDVQDLQEGATGG